MNRLEFAWLRTTVRMCGFAALLALFGCAAVVASNGKLPPGNQVQAQEEPKKEEPKAEPKTPEQEEEARIEETFKTPLGDEGVVPVKPASKVLRTVILRVPYDENWNDDPLECLSADARKQALAFESVLEQQIDYRPWLWRYDSPRVKRYSARLRFAGLAGTADSELQTRALKSASTAFNADVVLALSYMPENKSLRYVAWRYRIGSGIDFRGAGPIEEFSPEGAVLVKDLVASTMSIVGSLGNTRDEAELPAIPLLAANDKALSHFVAMRQCFEKGDLDGAWIEYAACLKADPKCGRAALFGMEIFRNHPSQLSPIRAVQEGIKGARATPNDVLLRGRLAYNASVWFKKKDWALAALETALKAQPQRYELLAWKAMIATDNEQKKMKAWLIEHVLPVCKDGRTEIAIGNADALSDNMGEAIEWYEKAIKVVPDDHEANFSLAIISTHHAEKLQRTAFIDSTGDEQRERAIKHFDRAVWAWNRCLAIDVTEQDMVLEFYVRAATRDYKYIPVEEADLKRLLLIQAVRNGLVKGAGGNNFSRLFGDLLPIQQKLMREWVKEAKLDDADYELRLLARLNFAAADKDDTDAVFVLRELRKRGYRGGAYIGFSERYKAQMDEADAKEKKDK